MYACVCVYVCVCTYVCMRVCMRVYMCVVKPYQNPDGTEWRCPGGC